MDLKGTCQKQQTCVLIVVFIIGGYWVGPHAKPPHISKKTHFGVSCIWDRVVTWCYMYLHQHNHLCTREQMQMHMLYVCIHFLCALLNAYVWMHCTCALSRHKRTLQTLVLVSSMNKRLIGRYCDAATKTHRPMILPGAGCGITYYQDAKPTTNTSTTKGEGLQLKSWDYNHAARGPW